MKKLSTAFSFSPKAGCFFVLAFSVALVFTGCSKQSATTTPTISTASSTISNDDVTQAVTNAVSGSTSGIASQSETTAILTASTGLGCGQTKDTAISGDNPNGDLFTWNYNLNFSRTSICTNGVVTQYNTSISGTNSYSLILMSSNDTTNAQISVSGIESGATAYVLNETYVLKGAQQSFISNQNFNSTLTFTSENVNIDKTTKKIISGSANIDFSGTNFSGKAFSRTASITFLGNNKATLVLDNGNSSTITW
jgi:hypothetical protein